MSPQRRFPNEVVSVSAARRFTLETVDGVASPLADAIAVMVSELAANAVRHTGSPFTVNIERAESLIRVAVSDAGTGSPMVRNPEPIEPTGRGLQIVQALAADWGVVPAPNPPGKTVWFSVDVDPALEEQAVAGLERTRPEHRDTGAGDGRAVQSPHEDRGTEANSTLHPERFGGKASGYSLMTHRRVPARFPPRSVDGEQRAQRKAIGLRQRQSVRGR